MVDGTRLEVFLAIKWKLNDSLIIQLGSVVVFNWCAIKAMRSWSLQITFADIERDFEEVGNIVFSKADKNGNEMASSLTIASINREEIFKAWW